MEKGDLSKISDQELLNKKRKIKTTSVTNAVLIGFMMGIIIYSAVNNSIGVFTFIPLVFIYKIVKDSKNINDLKQELKRRNLD